MDNRTFNVNGSGPIQLTNTLKLAFDQFSLTQKAQACAWVEDPKHGIILMWHNDGHAHTKPFMAPLTAEKVAPLVLEWLNSDEASKIPCEGDDSDLKHDGHNTPGFRVYCEKWGHVGENRYAICAVKPAWMWHGK